MYPNLYVYKNINCFLYETEKTLPDVKEAKTPCSSKFILYVC